MDFGVDHDAAPLRAMRAAKADLPLAVGPAIRVHRFLRALLLMAFGARFRYVTCPNAHRRSRRPTVCFPMSRRDLRTAVGATHPPVWLARDSLRHSVPRQQAKRRSPKRTGRSPAIPANAARSTALSSPVEGRRKRMLVADMDSTIIQQECLDEVARPPASAQRSPPSPSAPCAASCISRTRCASASLSSRVSPSANSTTCWISRSH